MLGLPAPHAWILGACALAACASPRPASTTPQPSSGPRAARSSAVPAGPSTRASPGAEACAAVTAPERLAIDAGAWRTSATGLSIRYEGASHDSFEGGDTDLSLSLVLWLEGEQSRTWLPSALTLPQEHHVILGHCVRVVGGSAARAELDVAPLPREGAAREHLARCAIDPTIAQLEDYALVADGRRYVIDVRRDPTGAWVPTPLPRMPHHHASRLSLRGLPDHPALAASGEVVPRFVIELLSHSVEQVPGHHEWRAEYVARVVDVCTP